MQSFERWEFIKETFVHNVQLYIFDSSPKNCLDVVGAVSRIGKDCPQEKQLAIKSFEALPEPKRLPSQY